MKRRPRICKDDIERDQVLDQVPEDQILEAAAINDLLVNAKGRRQMAEARRKARQFVQHNKGEGWKEVDRGQLRQVVSLVPSAKVTSLLDTIPKKERT